MIRPTTITVSITGTSNDDDLTVAMKKDATIRSAPSLGATRYTYLEPPQHPWLLRLPASRRAIGPDLQNHGSTDGQRR